MESELRTDRVRVREVIDRLRSGTLVVPEFQRAYVWKPGRATKLIDSLYRRYPIGCLLAWETTEQVPTRKARRGDHAPGATALFLIDGQQRTRTLERILVAQDEDGVEIYFHAIEGEFRRGNRTIRRDPLWLKVTDLWDPQWHEVVTTLCEENPDHAGEIRRNVDRCRAIQDYEIPLVVMKGHGFEEAVEAFERINTLGVRLKMQDLQSAELAARHVGFIRGKVIPLLAELKERGFDRLSTAHLYKVVSALARPEARKRPGIHELERQELDRAWERMKKGLDAVQELLAEDLGVQGMSLVWSGALLVPALVVLGHHRPGTRERRRLAGWMAAAALHHRYRGSTEAALEQDIRAALKDDPVTGLIKNLRRASERRRLEADPNDFWLAHLMDRGALFAAYLACRERSAKDPFSGAEVQATDPRAPVGRHHVFPRASFPPEERRDSDYVANAVFLHPETSVKVGKATAADYLPDLDESRLESQCIPTEPVLWENYEQFCWARAEELTESFNGFLTRCGVI